MGRYFLKIKPQQLCHHTWEYWCDWNVFCVIAVAASENNLHNKRLKLDYDEITPCLKEVTLVWEKMLATPDRPKVKVDMEIIHAALAQGKNLLTPMLRGRIHLHH